MDCETASPASVSRARAPRWTVPSYYRRRLLEEVDFAELAELTDAQRRVRLERIVGRMVTREGPVMTTSQRSALIRRVIDEAVGLGVLEPLLADESVTEIMVNGPERRVDRARRADRAGGCRASPARRSSSRRSTGSSRR